MTRKLHFYAGEPTDCAPNKCEELREELRKVCQANDWPPNKKVLICDPATGQCCNCPCP